MKKLWGIVLIIVALAVITSVMKDFIIKGAIESSISKATGSRLTMGSFKIDIWRSIIDIRDLKLANPPAFGKTYMVNAPLVYIAYDLPAIMKGKTHLKELRLDLKEFILTRAASGQTNIDTIRSRMAQHSGKRSDPSASGFLVDSLSLKIGRVAYKDLGEPSASRDFNINIDEDFSEITDIEQVVGIIITRAVINSGVARLANLDIADLRNMANSAMRGVVESAIGDSGFGSSETAKQAEGAIKGILNIFGSGDKK